MRAARHLDFRGCSGRVRRYRSLPKHLRGWLATELVPGHSVAPPGFNLAIAVVKFFCMSGYFVLQAKDITRILVANAVAFFAYDPLEINVFLEEEKTVVDDITSCLLTWAVIEFANGQFLMIFSVQRFYRNTFDIFKLIGIVHDMALLFWYKPQENITARKCSSV